MAKATAKKPMTKSELLNAIVADTDLTLALNHDVPSGDAGLAEAGLTIADERFYEGGSGFGIGRAMTEEVLSRTPDVDFLYYNSDINAAGGLLYCLEKGMDIPGRIGLAGFAWAISSCPRTAVRCTPTTPRSPLRRPTPRAAWTISCSRGAARC